MHDFNDFLRTSQLCMAAVRELYGPRVEIALIGKGWGWKSCRWKHCPLPPPAKVTAVHWFIWNSSGLRAPKMTFPYQPQPLPPLSNLLQTPNPGDFINPLLPESYDVEMIKFAVINFPFYPQYLSSAPISLIFPSVNVLWCYVVCENIPVPQWFIVRKRCTKTLRHRQ